MCWVPLFRPFTYFHDFSGCAHASLRRTYAHNGKVCTFKSIRKKTPSTPLAFHFSNDSSSWGRNSVVFRFVGKKLVHTCTSPYGLIVLGSTISRQPSEYLATYASLQQICIRVRSKVPWRWSQLFPSFYDFEAVIVLAITSTHYN